MKLRERLKKIGVDLLERANTYRWSAFAAFGVAGLFYLMNLYIKSGFVRWAITAPALLILVLTALARVNDLGKQYSGWRWQVRRLGLILAGTGAATLLLSPLSSNPIWPSWVGSMISWGFAAAWVTTPNMPPWHRYISGEFRWKETNNGKV